LIAKGGVELIVIEEKLVVNGPCTLKGTVEINGAKNAAVAILPASILAGGEVILDNLPNINDIHQLKKILVSLGARVDSRGERSIGIDTSPVDSWSPPRSKVQALRASYYFLGSLLARFGRAEVPIPGGCDLGPRPIDQHLKGLSALGADIKIEHGVIKARAKQLKGARIYLDVVSVGATINIMLAAVRAWGRTTIENAAKEPEIVDVANFLNAMGAVVRGAGTDVIKIQGVDELGRVEHVIIPDRIEAGTFMMAAAATCGDVILEDVIPKHLDPVTAKLKEIGAQVDVGADSIRVRGYPDPSPTDIKTFPYPGFPTDLQPLAMVLLTRARGTSFISENVFEHRFRHVEELKRMGACIKLEGRTAIIEGGVPLSGAPLTAMDLRAGAAFIIAGLMAKGETVIRKLKYIDRGYEKIEERFNKLGADLRRC
jgi:UDP-N-acetylglucosamine 1-carboxyvinyltransferase